MFDHPLLGDYHQSKFGGHGFFAIYSGERPVLEERRISLNAVNGRAGYLAIDDQPPEEPARRRVYVEGIALPQIEKILPWQEGATCARFSVEGAGIGHVEHVLGRDATEYHGRGSTSQNFSDCTLDLSVDSAGIVFDFSGTLSKQGFIGEVVSSLYESSYAVRFRMTWQVSRFYFHPNTLTLLFRRHIGESWSGARP